MPRTCRSLVLPLLLLALSISPVSAAPADGDASASPGTPITATVPGADKVSITGDHFVIDDAKHQATFTGNVVVIQKQVTVHSNQVTALYGKAGATSISTFTATGDVKLVTKDQTATGDVAVFNPKTHLLTLTGNVVVINKTGRVQSDKLVVDLSTKKSVFTTNGGRVTGVFSTNE
jgi:lipopolysaccharide export system protein LptA